MKGLNRLGDLLQGSEFRQLVNENWDIIEKGVLSGEIETEHLLNRVKNLVLTSGGNAPLELSDLRLSKLQNKKFDLAKDRLDSDIDYLAAALQISLDRIDTIEKKNEAVQYMLDRLYGLDSGTIEVYVDGTKGNDILGDGTFENPYKTITKAVINLPRIVNTNIFILCTPVLYDEEVTIPAIVGGRVYLRPTNFSSTNPLNPMGFQVKSITAVNLDWIHIGGLEQPSYTSYPLHFIRIQNCGEFQLEKVRVTANTKSSTMYGLLIHNSFGSIRNTRFQNQNIDLRAQFNSSVIIDADCTHGTASTRGLEVAFSKILKETSGTWSATTPTALGKGGFIYE